MACASSVLECPVCSGDYNEPKILPCGHLVCLKCILSWVEVKGHQATCPLCRLPIVPPGSGDPVSEVNRIPTDIYTAALVESQQVLHGPHICNVCENNTAATSYCIQCKIKLCSNCMKGHKKIPVTKTHSLENLDDLTLEKLAATHQVMCQAHPDRLAELYCQEHQKVICALCGTTNHGTCANCKTVPDMVTETKADLDRRVTNLQMKATELAKQVQHTKDHFKTVHKKVDETFDDLQEILEGQRQKHHRDIQVVEDALAASQSDMEKTRTSLTQNTSSVGHMVCSASGGVLLQMLKALKTRLDDLDKKAEMAEAIKAANLMTDFTVNAAKLSCLKKDMAGLGYVSKPRETTMTMGASLTNQEQETPTSGHGPRPSPTASSSEVAILCSPGQDRSTSGQAVTIPVDGHRGQVCRPIRWIQAQ